MEGQGVTPRAVAALAILGAVALVVACYAVWHRHQRPPVPDALTPSIAAERKAQHIYLVHALTSAGESRGPWVCEEANVGEVPVKGAKR